MSISELSSSAARPTNPVHYFSQEYGHIPGLTISYLPQTLWGLTNMMLAQVGANRVAATCANIFAVQKGHLQCPKTNANRDAALPMRAVGLIVPSCLQKFGIERRMTAKKFYVRSNSRKAFFYLLHPACEAALEIAVVWGA